MSQVTSHVLDTSKGTPAAGIVVILLQWDKHEWLEIGKSVTNTDGRVADLLTNGVVVPTGTYKLKFRTAEYFERLPTQGFYPFIEIVFEITTQEHYHVPLLLNPFGYSTYRGS